MKTKKYGAEVIGDSDKHDPDKECKPGYSWWIENGVYYQAPTVDPKKFGPHEYNMPHRIWAGLGTCRCGCYMGSSSSSGDCDPFGHCPLNPNPFA